MTSRRRPDDWDAYPQDVKDFVDRELDRIRPFAECDPAHVTRVAIALGLRPAVLDDNQSQAAS